MKDCAPFLLQVTDNEESGKTNLVIHCRLPDSSSGDYQYESIIRIDDKWLPRLEISVLNALRETGHCLQRVCLSRECHYELSEVAGMRLALIFQAVKPLQRDERINQVIHGLQNMTEELCYYWYGKVRNGKVGQPLRALRILLAKE